MNFVICEIMQIALEIELRRDLQVHAARADTSIKDWLLDNLSRQELKFGLEAYIADRLGSLIIMAPPTNVDRLNVRLEDPKIELALQRVAENSQRTRPQVLYTLIQCLVRDQDAAETKSSNFYNALRA